MEEEVTIDTIPQEPVSTSDKMEEEVAIDTTP